MSGISSSDRLGGSKNCFALLWILDFRKCETSTFPLAPCVEWAPSSASIVFVTRSLVERSEVCFSLTSDTFSGDSLRIEV